MALVASPILLAVSLRYCRSVAVLRVPDDMSASISVSVGMNGRGSSSVYFGSFHVCPLYLRYCLYILATVVFVVFFHDWLAIVSFTCSGLSMLQSWVSRFSRAVAVVLVSSALPSFFCWSS